MKRLATAAAPRDIDVDFDFRSDTPPDGDPDADSPTLRRYHKLLWSKPLPNGSMFDLAEKANPSLLIHRSALGEFSLSSDGAITTFRKEVARRPFLKQIPASELEAFQRIGYTIGAIIVFPSNRIGRAMTINGARGFSPQVKDRFDLTVECIRRHFRNEDSPLREVLARYAAFFSLFGDFRGYIEHFLLQDIVADDFTSIKFFAPFDDFVSPPVPSSMEAYVSYRHLATDFIRARNKRIRAWCLAQPSP